MIPREIIRMLPMIRRSRMTVVKPATAVPEKYRNREGRGLQLLEHRDGLEGFYLIRMRRKYD